MSDDAGSPDGDHPLDVFWRSVKSEIMERYGSLRKFGSEFQRRFRNGSPYRPDVRIVERFPPSLLELDGFHELLDLSYDVMCADWLGVINPRLEFLSDACLECEVPVLCLHCGRTVDNDWLLEYDTCKHCGSGWTVDGMPNLLNCRPDHPLCRVPAQMTGDDEIAQLERVYNEEIAALREDYMERGS